MGADEFDGDGLGVEEVRAWRENGFRLGKGTGKDGRNEANLRI